jgi:Ras-related protein Rab-1A
MSRDYDFLFKFVIIGDSAVGKSSLLLKFADDVFTESYISTIGVDFRFRTITIDNYKVKLQIWDTAGQERFKTITAAYYRGADAVLICYDTTNLQSFEHIQEWLLEVQRVNGDNLQKIIVGTKADMEDKREISYDVAQKFAEDNGCEIIETSAKTSTNVDVAFLTIASKLIKTKYEVKDNKHINLIDHVKKTKNRCC